MASCWVASSASRRVNRQTNTGRTREAGGATVGRSLASLNELKSLIAVSPSCGGNGGFGSHIDTSLTPFPSFPITPKLKYIKCSIGKVSQYTL